MLMTIDEILSKITETQKMIDIQDKFLNNCDKQLRENPHKGLMRMQKDSVLERIQYLKGELRRYKRELKGRER